MKIKIQLGNIIINFTLEIKKKTPAPKRPRPPREQGISKNNTVIINQH